MSHNTRNHSRPFYRTPGYGCIVNFDFASLYLQCLGGGANLKCKVCESKLKIHKLAIMNANLSSRFTINLFKEVWDGALLFWKMADKLRRGLPFALQTLKCSCSGRRNATKTEILTPADVHSKDQKWPQYLTTSN